MAKKKDRKAYDTTKPPEFNWSEEFRKEWPSLPLVLRQEIWRSMDELSRGVQKYAPHIEPLRPFLEYVEGQGKTLTQYLLEMTSIESLLKRDLIAGLRQISIHCGIDPDKELPSILVAAGAADKLAANGARDV